MKIIKAYYLRICRDMIAVTLPDGRTMATRSIPSRNIKSELKERPVFRRSACKVAILREEMPEYVYRFYGLEK